jgi:hypothetical protein
LQCLTEQLSQVRKPDPGREQGLKTMTKSAQKHRFRGDFRCFYAEKQRILQKVFRLVFARLNLQVAHSNDQV